MTTDPNDPAIETRGRSVEPANEERSDDKTSPRNSSEVEAGRCLFRDGLLYDPSRCVLARGHSGDHVDAAGNSTQQPTPPSSQVEITDEAVEAVAANRFDRSGSAGQWGESPATAADYRAWARRDLELALPYMQDRSTLHGADGEASGLENSQVGEAQSSKPPQVEDGQVVVELSEAEAKAALDCAKEGHKRAWSSSTCAACGAIDKLRAALHNTGGE